MSLLKTENLSKRFGGLTAVSEVSFQIEPGEIAGLIGPNGAGKTTLFNLLTGFEKPDQGKVFFDGRDITGIFPYIICQQGLVRTFQNVKPFMDVSIIDNVMMAAFLRTPHPGEAREESGAILKFTGLWDKRNFLCKNLTIADRKRTEVARSLATKPKLILLDEVMAGLNPTEVKEMMKLIREIHEQGVTLLVIEHVMDAIMAMCEKIIVLNEGKKIVEGTPAEVSNDKRVIEIYLGEEDFVVEGQEY